MPLEELTMADTFLTTMTRFFRWQRYLSQALDRRLPKYLWTDGHRDFLDNVCPASLIRGQLVYDIGGGRSPCIDVTTKHRLELRVVGLDISRDELEAAPEWAYDDIMVSDIAQYRGHGDADLVVMSASLEHIEEVPAAFIAISSILAPGGRALIWAPSRTALYARLNLLLPEPMKNGILDLVNGYHDESLGFRAFYRSCTPKEFRQLAECNGLRVEEERLFYVSSYFYFLLPAYFVWRLWVLTQLAIDSRSAAESFAMVLRKV
jgi:SAM-dependent methyltransferase